MTPYELHPLCSLFPRMIGAEFDALRDDIKANGLRHPIVLKEGMILDGGNRYKACLAAGVEPVFIEFSGGSLVEFVLSQNLHRRHMTPGQQAAIVSSAQDWARAQGRGGDRKSDQSATLHLDSAASRAAESGACLRTQKMADKVAKADPELAKQVGYGEISLPNAVKKIDSMNPKKKSKKQEPTPADEDDEIDGVDRDDLIEALTEENKRLTEENNRLTEENATLRMAAGADKVKTVEGLKAYLAVVESQYNESMIQCNALKREVKALRRRLGFR